MKNGQLVAISLIIMLLSILAACAGESSGVDSSGSVTFSVPIDAQLFSEEAILKIRLWNADQLEILQKTASCAVSFNVELQVEEIDCPEGVEYEVVTAQEISIPIQDINKSATFSSDTISVGERYRLLITGLSNDDCNTTSASMEAIAQQAEITFEDLGWATTEMGCL
ncbi:MAG: hypothetical protein IIC78_09620 [Chloroflexi bacterium]|nr:hypothetical protein [Chloroflexota bacterium]